MAERNLDFDKVINRKNTRCLKYDFAVKRGKPADVLPLWVADMDFETSSYIEDALVERAKEGIFGYSEVQTPYFEILANWMKTHHNWDVREDWLIKTPGVVFALAMAVKAYTQPGDSVLIQLPVYYPFSEVIQDNGRKVVSSNLYQGEDNRYHTDFQDFEKKIVEENVKLFFLCNPHNPVGRVWTREELERVAEICLKYNVTWMVDEMHCDFIFPGHTFTSCMNLDEKYRQILALYSSPGKTFNVAGLQPANIIIPNEELRKKYQWANTQAAYSQGSLMGQLAVKVCYTKGAGWVDELVQYIYENVQYMSKFVKENFPKAKMVEPEGTYLVWVDFSGYGFSNEELEHLMLEEAKLWLDSGIIFGPETAQFERFNVACPRATVKQALTQLKDALDKHLAAK